MTREMQDTDRALQLAEHNWLVARGWVGTRPLTDVLGRVRYSHPSAPVARDSYTARDALAMTRADPLRFMARRFTSPGPA